MPKVAPAYCDYVLLVLMDEDETASELMLMSVGRYRCVGSWFASSSFVGERRLLSSVDLIGEVTELVDAAKHQKLKS